MLNQIFGNFEEYSGARAERILPLAEKQKKKYR
jgi:hypothetical protein